VLLTRARSYAEKSERKQQGDFSDHTALSKLAEDQMGLKRINDDPTKQTL
jgi:hypothetical protein